MTKVTVPAWLLQHCPRPIASLAYFLLGAALMSGLYTVLFIKYGGYAEPSYPTRRAHVQKWADRPILEARVLRQGTLFPMYVHYLFDGIDVAAKEYDISPTLLLAISQTESRFYFNAISNKGCIGIMQVNPAVWVAPLIRAGVIRQVSDLYDPQRNIRAGAYIFRDCLNASGGNVERALGKYLGAPDPGYTGSVIGLVGDYDLEAYYARRAHR